MRCLKPEWSRILGDSVKEYYLDRYMYMCGLNKTKRLLDSDHITMRHINIINFVPNVNGFGFCLIEFVF